MIFNGVDLEQYFEDDFIVKDVRGRTITQNELETLSIPLANGEILIESKIPPKILEVDIALNANTKRDLNKKIDELNSIIHTKETVPIVFKDEPDMTYYGIIGTSNEEPEEANVHEATLNIVVLDGLKYGPLREIKLDVQTNKIYYAGTEPTIPTIKMTATKPLTYIGYSNGNDFVAMGSTVTEGATPVPENTVILSDDFSNLGLWQTGTTTEDVVNDGTFASGPRGLFVRDFGTTDILGWGWYGPMIQRSLNQSLADFEVDVYMDNINKIDELSRLDLYLKDENGVLFGRITIADLSDVARNNTFYSWVGSSTSDRLFLSYHERKEWNPFSGLLRIRKIGNVFEIYATSINSNGMHYASYSKRYVDGEKKYTKKLAGIAVQISKNAKYKAPSESFIKRVVVKRPNLNNENIVRNVAETGDVIEVKDGLIYKNGEVYMDRFHASSNFFPLQKGENSLAFTDGVEAIISFREAFK